LNATGKMYISHTKLDGKYILRLMTSQTHVELAHVRAAWKIILEKAGNLQNSLKS
jgi:aromatic-L-amino-acid decarboxylase